MEKERKTICDVWGIMCGLWRGALPLPACAQHSHLNHYRIPLYIPVCQRNANGFIFRVILHIGISPGSTYWPIWYLQSIAVSSATEGPWVDLSLASKLRLSSLSGSLVSAARKSL